MNATTGSLTDDPTPVLLFFLKEAAPEKTTLIDEYSRLHPLSFRTEKEDHSLRLRAYVRLGIIEIGVNCIARLWARAVAYEYIWRLMVEQLKTDSSAITFNIDIDHIAIQLLSWSVICEWNVALKELTGEIEFNMAHALKEMLPVNATELFKPVGTELAFQEAKRIWKYAMGYLMHHEFVHIRRKHESDEGFPSIEEEKSADREAAEWMLDAIDEGINEFFYRSQGIALALLWLAGTEVHTGPLASKSHPAGYDRLFQVLDQFINNPNHPTWAFVAVVLKVHFLAEENEGIEVTQFSSAREEANYYIDVISRQRPD